MTLINLTPHTISFIYNNETILTVEPSGKIARVKATTVTVGEFAGIPITETRFGEVEGLPDPEDGVGYIVSSLVAQRCKDRLDVFIPNESVRNDKGQIIGCKSLARV